MSFDCVVWVQGFRKVDSDRWEFANEGFQGGKKHLLKNIRRKSKYNKLQQGQPCNAMKPGLESEFEKLKKDQNILKVEILKLRQQQESSQNQLINAQERVRSAELKQHQMLFFLTRMARRPTLVQQLLHEIKRKRELDGGEIGKRRRLLGTQVTANFPEAVQIGSIVDYTQVREDLGTVRSELNSFQTEPVNTSRMNHPAPSPWKDGLCSPVQGLRASFSRACSGHDANSACHIMSKKLMDENLAVEEELDVNDSNIYLELEDLINKPTDWSASASELARETGCI